MAKLFGKGLGIEDSSMGSSLSVDTQLLKSNNLSSNQDLTDALFTTQQLTSDRIEKGGDQVQFANPVLNLLRRPQLKTEMSSPAPFETLYNDFDLQAYPFYNFWTPDETTNDRDGIQLRNLEDVPRYIKLSWIPAPDLKDPEEKQVPKTVGTRTIEPIIFSREIEKPSGFRVKGLSFSPEHLQIKGFETAKSMLANGSIAPGVIESVVDLPLTSTKLQNDKIFSPTSNVDEDSFLTNESYAGISIHELEAQVNQLVDPIASIASLDLSMMSPALASKKSELVDGKVLMSSTSRSGGTMKISSVHPSSPTLSLTANTSTTTKKENVDEVERLSSSVQKSDQEQQTEVAHLKVKFVDTSIGGLVDKKRINLMKSPEHVDTAIAIAPSLSKLEMLARTRSMSGRNIVEPPSLPSPKVKPLEYIGYVIEKYVRQPSGAFVKVDEIDIPSREADYFIDSKVLYNKIYRYRMKAIIRWTRPSSFTIEGPDVTVSETFASNATKLANYKSSYFSSEWGTKWSYASCTDNQPPPPPDELTVRPESHKKRISISFKVPEDSQKDVLGMRLYRKVKDENGIDITDWERLGGDFGPENVLFFDEFKENNFTYFQQIGQKFVYAATTITKHGEESNLSEQLCARLNQDYFSKGEFPVEFISCAGVRKQYFGNFSVYPHSRMKMEVKRTPKPTRIGKSPGKSSISFGSRSAFGTISLTDSNYIIRIQSLDTGEKKDIPLSSKIVNTPTVEHVEETDIFAANYNILSNAVQTNTTNSNTNVTNNLPKTRGEELIPRDYPLPGESYKTSG